MKSGSHKRAMKGERKNEREMERKFLSHYFQLLFSFVPQPFRLVPNLAGPGRSKLGWIWYSSGHLFFFKLHKSFQNVMLKLQMPHAHRLPWSLTCVAGAWWKRKDPGERDEAAPVRHSMWSLHNVVFFIAFILHLNEIFKSLAYCLQSITRTSVVWFKAI